MSGIPIEDLRKVLDGIPRLRAGRTWKSIGLFMGTLRMCTRVGMHTVVWKTTKEILELSD